MLEYSSDEFSNILFLDTSKSINKLSHADRNTIIDGIASIGEMVVPGEDAKALNIGNIG